MEFDQSLNQMRSRYWLTVGAIALSGGVAVVFVEIALSLLLKVELHLEPAALAYNQVVAWQTFWGMPLLGSLVVGSVAVPILTPLLKQSQSQARLRCIFDGAAIGMGLDRLDGTILASNPALQAMLGYTQSELTKTTFAKFTHPDDVAIDVELFQDMVLGRRDSYQIEKRHIHKNGQVFWVRLTNSLVRDQQGTPQYTIAVVENINSLKQAQENVQLYGDMVKRMPFGLLVWQLPDLEDLSSFQLIECNAAAQQIFQFAAPLDSLLGKPMADVLPDFENTAFPRIYQDVIRSGKTRDLGEVRHGDRPTSASIFATKAIPLPNQCVGIIFEDITEHKQAEVALQQSEARFRVVAETASCAFLVYQGNRLRYVNPAAEQITGYSEEELVSMDFWELAHPEFQALIRDRGLARQRGETVPRRYEFKILTKSGAEKWVDMTGGSAYLDGQPAALATAYDITERKAAEARLKLAAEQERLLSEIALRIRGSLDLQEILNTTVAEVRQFLQVDRVFITYLESDNSCWSVAESVAPNLTSTAGVVPAPILAPTVAKEIRQLFGQDSMRVISDTSQIERSPFLKEYCDHCQVKAGMGVPIRLNGEMFGVLLVSQCSGPREWQPFEVDLLKKLGTQVEIALQQGQLYHQLQTLAASLECQVEERTLELRQRMQELQSLNQVKDVLLHAVTHDLRTPLHGMLMVLKSLSDKGTETVSIPRSMLNCMIQSSDRQLSLLNSLMEDHCCPQPHLMLKRELVYLSGVMENALVNLGSQLAKNEAIVVSHLPADLPAVPADPLQLQQVLEHFLSNATKHNPPHRTITISAQVSTEPESAPDVAPNCPTPYLYCSISDDGNGMTQEQCDRLFHLYIRGIDKQHLTGIGLGLHHCQQVITAHGGKIGVSSQLDAGSTFWFALPLS